MQNQNTSLSNTERYTITAALPYTNGPVHIGHLAGVYIPAAYVDASASGVNTDVANYQNITASGIADDLANPGEIIVEISDSNGV